MLESFGTALFFVFIAAAVACFLISGAYKKPWKFIGIDPLELDVQCTKSSVVKCPQCIVPHSALYG